MHYFSDVFDKVLYLFRTGPLSIIRSISILYTRNRYLPCCSVGCLLAWSGPDHSSRQPTELTWQLNIACLQCWASPDDGQWNCPKYV